jgi:O-antigen/teichoic acid export membrane protein
MNESHNAERLFIAACALVLFLAGLLVPLVVAEVIVACSGPNASLTGLTASVVLAVAFGFIAEVLALILGILGRQHLSGKIAVIGAVTGLVLAAVLAVLWGLNSRFY